MAFRRNTRQDAEALWDRVTSPAQTPAGAGPGTPRRRTAPGTRADEITQVARQLTEAATALRQANVARLRQVRLDQEAQDRAPAALALPIPKRQSRRGSPGRVLPSQP